VTRTLPVSPAAIAEAATLIAAGEPVAVPTETVYGLAADATSGEAVARIYTAKGRPSFNPLIIHAPDLDTATAIAALPKHALSLAKTFWPGPLTIVAPLRNDAPIASLATAGLPTVALRIPAHPAMQALLRACGRPLAAPSANASGSISPTRADHVARSLAGRIPLIVDGGPTGLGLESTIVAIDKHRLRLLRPGPITIEELEQASGLSVGTSTGSSIEAPGQLVSHYAPTLPLRLNADAGRDNEWLIGFGAIGGDRNLSAEGDLPKAAAHLFDALYEADGSGRAAIAVAPIPSTGLGLAINDRLQRAAAPRP
jgi:L-threonylcarbamoyladenylate synthase